jgi:hypothetical protein
MFMLPTISLRIERWKFNKDYGVYVSTLGNFKDRYKRRLPINVTNQGYCTVKTEAPGQWPKAHRLVMLTWKPIPNAENLTVDHLNHNKRDNSVANLEWVTREENQRRAKEDYIVLNKKGQLQKQALSIFSPKITVEEYRKHLMGYEVNGIRCADAEAIFNVMKGHCNLSDEDLMNKIKNIVQRFETRYNIGNNAGLRIKKGLVIVPIYDKTIVLK